MNWGLDFFLSPTAFNHTSHNAEQLESVSFVKNAYIPGADPLDRTARVQESGPAEDIPASAAFRSVGYKSLPLPGMDDVGVSFDLKKGVIMNDGFGRAIQPNADNPETPSVVTGMYCAGWVKRGPVGVIASTMQDAFATADSVVEDWDQGTVGKAADGPKLGWEGVRSEAEKAGCRPVTWSEWRRIDQVEREKGRSSGKPREKLTSVKAMLDVLDG